MLDVDFILRGIERIRDNQIILRQIGSISLEAFMADPLQHGSAERFLQVNLEICLDITRHVISTQALGNPQTHAEAFDLLARAGIVPTDFLRTLIRMAGFRNRLVHLYWDIEQETVHDILRTRLTDFDQFVNYVVIYLDQNHLI